MQKILGDLRKGENFVIVENHQTIFIITNCSHHRFLHQRMNANGTGTKWLFSWNNKYNKYNNYTFSDTFTCFFLSYARQLTLCMLASRSHAGVVILGFLSSSHVFSLPLSGLNWRSLFLPWDSGPPFSNMAAPFTGSAHTPLPGSGTLTLDGRDYLLVSGRWSGPSQEPLFQYYSELKKYINRSLKKCDILCLQVF